HCYSAPSSSPPLALPINSDPTAHSAFVLQIRFTESRGEIFLFAKDDAVMKDQRERDDKEQRNQSFRKTPSTICTKQRARYIGLRVKRNGPRRTIVRVGSNG